MARRYEDPVEVRPAPDGDRPASFLWHGRLYVVRDVLGHWRERRAWWTSAAARAVHGDGSDDPDGAAGTGMTGPAGGPGFDGPEPRAVAVRPDVTREELAREELAREREVWRVEASRGRAHGTGVFDLCREVLGGPGARGDAWRLVRVAD